MVANLFDHDVHSISDRVTCYSLFIDPALGRIGMNVAEARASGRPVLQDKMMMQRVGRAREAGETQGFMKVRVDADSKRLPGKAILGLDGDEGCDLLEVMLSGQHYTVISRAMHIHPTVSELVPTLLQQLKPLVWAPCTRIMVRSCESPRAHRYAAQERSCDSSNGACAAGSRRRRRAAPAGHRTTALSSLDRGAL